MTRYVVQRGPGDYVRVDASSPRAAVVKAAGDGTPGVIVWYRTRTGWASWADDAQSRTRYMGKVDERVDMLLDESPRTKTNRAGRP